MVLGSTVCSEMLTALLQLLLRKLLLRIMANYAIGYCTTAGIHGWLVLEKSAKELQYNKKNLSALKANKPLFIHSCPITWNSSFRKERKLSHGTTISWLLCAHLKCSKRVLKHLLIQFQLLVYFGQQSVNRQLIFIFRSNIPFS